MRDVLCMLTSEHLFEALRGDADISTPRGQPRTGARKADRQTARASLTGWAQVLLPHQAPLHARTHDMSMAGFAIFLDLQLGLSKDYRVVFTIYRHGRIYNFEVQAYCVCAVLVRTNGFKHGFQFSALDEIAEDALRALLV